MLQNQVTSPPCPPYTCLSHNSYYHLTMSYVDENPKGMDPKICWLFQRFFATVILQFVHDQPTGGHPGRNKTLTDVRCAYYWPRTRVDTLDYVARCISCAKHKRVASDPAPMIACPPPKQPWDVVANDILQLPKSHQSS